MSAFFLLVAIFASASSFDPRMIPNRHHDLCLPCINGECLLEKCFCHPGWTGIDCNTPSMISQDCSFLCQMVDDDMLWCPSNTTDACRFHEDYGIMQVDKTRWEMAQKFELKFWKYQDDDFKHYVKKDDFLNWIPLENKALGHVLEIACGPITHIGSIIDSANVTVSSITLVDPIIFKYLTEVSSCDFANGTVRDYPTSLMSAMGETMQFGEIFDTVIAVNAVEHCMDGFAFLRNVYNSLKPGGLIIWHETAYEGYYGHPVHENPIDHIYHPLRARKRFWQWWIDHFTLEYLNQDGVVLRNAHIFPDGVYDPAKASASTSACVYNDYKKWIFCLIR